MNTKDQATKTSQFMQLILKILLNARASVINNALSIEGDGPLLEATLFSNVLAIT